MQQILLFALLGLGPGALIAGIALGVVAHLPRLRDHQPGDRRRRDARRLRLLGAATDRSACSWSTGPALVAQPRGRARCRRGDRAGRVPAAADGLAAGQARLLARRAARPPGLDAARVRQLRAARAQRAAPEHRASARRGDPDRTLHPHRDRHRCSAPRWPRSTASPVSAWQRARRPRTRWRRCSAGSRPTRCRWSTR